MTRKLETRKSAALCAVVVASAALFAPVPAQAARSCWSFVRDDCIRFWEDYSQFYPNIDACVEGEYPKMCPQGFDAPIQSQPMAGRIEE
ncbi:MAG TPA: hypothetical protein VF548_17620 [Allosphingosinicella sp.]|jgi:hypothetical protein